MKISLKSLLILFSLFVAILGNEIYRQTRQTRVANHLLRDFADIEYGLSLAQNPVWDGRMSILRQRFAGAYRWLSGSSFFDAIVKLEVPVGLSPDFRLEKVAALPHLKWFQMIFQSQSGEPCPCPDIAVLADCRQLECLILGAWVSENPDQLAVRNEKMLSMLTVGKPQLEAIQQCAKLRVLVVATADDTPLQFELLAEHSSLEWLYLRAPNFSDEQWQKLRQELPSVEIVNMEDVYRDYKSDVDLSFCRGRN